MTHSAKLQQCHFCQSITLQTPIGYSGSDNQAAMSIILRARWAGKFPRWNCGICAKPWKKYSLNDAIVWSKCHTANEQRNEDPLAVKCIDSILNSLMEIMAPKSSSSAFLFYNPSYDIFTNDLEAVVLCETKLLLGLGIVTFSTLTFHNFFSLIFFGLNYGLESWKCH